ncbi:MAG: hypothetical protein KIT84_10625 [Labilithrix sp.]|nr:hypothetical protein [Labilithrix sp.]MCW5811460.1 hypothetical protein [Labilithrix sp.]
MAVRSAASLLEELSSLDESTTIEAKEAKRIDRSVLETVCAFSTEPGLEVATLRIYPVPLSRIPTR